MDEQLKVFLATIYGESAQSSPAAWRAIASVIMNRVGVREWRKYKTPLAVIANTGFDAFTQRNVPYASAARVLEKYPSSIGPNSPLGRLLETVLPIYRGDVKPIPEIVLYFSPKAQASLHAKKPEKWPAAPRWKFEQLTEVPVKGAEKDDFKFFKYATVVA